MTDRLQAAVATTAAEQDRFAQGCATFERVTGLPASALLDQLSTTSPDFGRFIMEWEFADVYSRPALDLRTREIVILAACAALGATGKPALKLHIGSALHAGVSREEIAEVFIQVAFAAGLPAALIALEAAGEVFAATPLDRAA